MQASYVVEMIGQCSHRGQLTLGGNAFDVSSLTATCPICSTQAKINSAQAVGLDPSAPDFDQRLEELTEGFSTFTYYYVTAVDGQVKFDLKLRKKIIADFLLFCNTCKKEIPIESNTAEKIKTGHHKHDITLTFKGDSPPAGVLLETLGQNMQQFLGQALTLEKSENRFRVKW